MTPEELEHREDTLSLINTEIASRLDRQSDSLAKIDSKAGLVVGYAFAAASFLATRHAQPILAAFAYVGLGAAAATGVTALAVWNFQDTEPAALLAHANSSPAAIFAALISRRVMIYRINNAKQRRKARQWWLCLGAAVAGTVLMVLAILVQTYGHDRPEQQHGRPSSGALHIERGGSATGVSPGGPRGVHLPVG